jgi:hypothetical protein
MALITDRAVLTQEANQLSMQLGTGCHGDLVWSDQRLSGKKSARGAELSAT